MGDKMKTEQRVLTTMFTTEGVFDKTVSAVMVDFHCDSTSNEDFIYDINREILGDVGVYFKHEIINCPIPPIDEFGTYANGHKNYLVDAWGHKVLKPSDNEHREALLSYLVMEAIACEGRLEIDRIERETTRHIYCNYNELTACAELERKLS